MPRRSPDTPQRSAPVLAAALPENHELSIFDGLLVGRAVLLLARRKHGATATVVVVAIIPCGAKTAFAKRIAIIVIKQDVWLETFPS